MALTRLTIRDFRNIESADLAPAEGFNFLVGANGSGKPACSKLSIRWGTGGLFVACRQGE